LKVIDSKEKGLNLTIFSDLILIQTTENTDIIDITQQVSEKVLYAGLKEGSITLFIPGSTASLSTIEFERGVINDLRKAIEKMAPQDIYYEHNERWGDGNGYSHVRAAILGPSLFIPLQKGKMTLGTWQQIVLIDFDNRPRKRKIILQIFGE
jgi:secondary thiamine-phosphate synthase enzyme